MENPKYLIELLNSTLKFVKARGFTPTRYNFFADFLYDMKRREYREERGEPYDEPNISLCVDKMNTYMKRKYDFNFNNKRDRTRLSFVFDKQESDEKLFVFFGEEETAKKKDAELFSDYIMMLGNDGIEDPNVKGVFVYESKISSNPSNFLSKNELFSMISDQDLLNNPMDHFLQSKVKLSSVKETHAFSEKNSVNMSIFPSTVKTDILPLFLGASKGNLISIYHETLIEGDGLLMSENYRMTK